MWMDYLDYLIEVTYCKDSTDWKNSCKFQLANYKVYFKRTTQQRLVSAPLHPNTHNLIHQNRQMNHLPCSHWFLLQVVNLAKEAAVLETSLFMSTYSCCHFWNTVSAWWFSILFWDVSVWPEWCGPLGKSLICFTTPKMGFGNSYTAFLLMLIQSWWHQKGSPINYVGNSKIKAFMFWDSYIAKQRAGHMWPSNCALNWY